MGIKAEVLSKKSPRFEYYVAKRNGEIHGRNMDARKRSDTKGVTMSFTLDVWSLRSLAHRSK